LTGVLAHGRGFYGFVWQDMFGHDASQNFTCIMKVLHNIIRTEGKLPPVLFVQMDNAPSENKNRYMLALGELLVRTYAFKEVRIAQSFLH
jgi:hypothetical protein